MMNLSFKLPVSIFKEGKYFIAYTPVLDLSTSAKTYESVQGRFAEIVNIFFEEVIKKGTLDEVLKNLGWQKVKKQWTPPLVVSQKLEEIKIPAMV
jgi:predicted RNase H-like HicB family nuclease